MNPIPVPPDLPDLVYREVRIWPSSRPGQFRLEFDQRPSGLFSGLWVTSKTLSGTLQRLLPHITDAELSQTFDHLARLVMADDPTSRFVELRHFPPGSRNGAAQPVEIQDFQFY